MASFAFLPLRPALAARAAAAAGPAAMRIKKEMKSASAVRWVIVRSVAGPREVSATGRRQRRARAAEDE